MTAPAASGAPARLSTLPDGTAVAPGRRGELRLSQDRKRWWNGVQWQQSATTTPPESLRSDDGTRWWDGEEWRPVTDVRAWYEAPLVLCAIYAVPLVLALVGSAANLGPVLVLGYLATVAWIGLAVRSRLLNPRARGLYGTSAALGLALSVFTGFAPMLLLPVLAMGLEFLLARRQARGRDGRVNAAARL